MARESNLWKWLAKARLIYPDLHMTRVENGVGSGMPDVEGCRGRAQFWIELKSAARPARGSTPIRFATRDRETQVEWATKRIAAGGRVAYLLQVGDGPSRRIYLLSGRLAQQIHNGMTEDEIAKRGMAIDKPEDVIMYMTGGEG